MTEAKAIEVQIPDYPGDGASVTIKDGRIMFVTLHYDRDVDNPLTESGTANGTIYSLGRRHSNYDPDAVQDAVENNPDHVKLSYFEHGQCRWSVLGDTVPGEEFQWDGAKFAGVWVPDADALANIGPNPEGRWDRIIKYAKGVCEMYTQFCNGEVYGYSVTLHKLQHDPDGDAIEESDYYDRHSSAIEEDSCWGFYGLEYVREEALRVATDVLGDE